MNALGIKSDKQIMSERVIKEASQSKSLEELEERLNKLNIKTYKRKGRFYGVYLPNNQKRRLTTLGVSKENLRILTLEQERLEQLRKLKNKSNEHDRERD